MARVSVIEFWRDIYGSDPNIMMDRYLYHAATDSVEIQTVNIGGGGLSAFHPPAGTMVGEECDGPDLVQYFSLGNNVGVNDVQTDNAASCCTLAATDFNIVKTNNTVLLTPNGTIKITAPVLAISDYEASIDGGVNYVTQIDDEITFENLPAGNYEIIIRTIAGACSVTTNLVIVDQISYPPPIISENTLPALYAPVFFPIVIGYTLDNNQATVNEDVNGTYLEVDNQDGKDYLATLPIIKIFDNADYAGTYQITEVDNTGNPQKFYFNKTFTTEQEILFVPFDRQVFQLFAERAFNNYKKIADISVYPDATTGEYRIRLEGFLQSVFQVMPPVNNGDEITLLRKYYVLPQNFDLSGAYTVLNAVYSAIPDLTDFLTSLTPLGPAPINFINEQSQKGYPVLFSYIDTISGRIKNITSSDQTTIVNAGTQVFINALPLNQYDFSWINPAGAIADLQVSPALPSWITVVPGASDTVQLTIDTGASESDGDYDGSDYSGNDYLTGGPNIIVGCYEYEFSDGVTPLFTLTICVFPIQKSNQVCVVDPLNIAWVNREGGWSSYVFDGRKTFSKDIGEVSTYKTGIQLKRSTVDNVYDTVEINLANKSIKDLIFISSLRQSIQAFLWSAETLQWSIPIVIDKQSFPVYTKPFKQVDQADKFRFKYAEEVVIQTQ